MDIEREDLVPPVTNDRGRHLVGLIGGRIGTSLSPQLHEREADEIGLRYLYQLIDIDDLGLGAADVGALLAEARRMGFCGLNITHPCKQAVIEHLDDLSPVAAELRAVNTVVFADGRSTGHNTDSPGFEAAFAREFGDVPMGRVVVLGAGGAGAAAGRAALRLGAGVLTVVDHLPARAGELTATLSARYDGRVRAAGPDRLEEVMADADGLIQATPAGMEPQYGMPLAPQLVRPGMWVAEIIYRPVVTELLRHARSQGCRTLSGVGMLVFQAASAFRLFTGRAPDTERMFRHAYALTDSLRAAGPVDDARSGQDGSPDAVKP